MRNELICPQCHEVFYDEDFCSGCGTRLEPRSAATVPIETVQGEAHATGRIDGFMKRLGLRRVSEVGTPRDEAPPQAASEMPSPLPEDLREKGWRIAGPVHTGAGLDLWPVKGPAANGRVYFHRYRTGALTTHDIYCRLEGLATPQLAGVLAHGTVDFGGARTDYELVSLPETGVGLDQWLARSLPSEKRALHLLPMLSQLLKQLADLGVRPLTLEPARLLLVDDKLWLSSAAVLANVTDVDKYCAEFERSSLLPRGWTAPELTQQNMSSANAAIFSVGQVLAQAAWGQLFSIDEIQTGAVPFPSIVDGRLARILMGCLWPRSAERWTYDDLLAAAACTAAEAMPATPPWESLTPGAAGTAFSLGGESFWRLDDLLAAAVKPTAWGEATSRIGEIIAWARLGTAWAGQAGLVRDALLDEGRSADWALVALARAVRPDAPVTWRDLDLSDDEAARSLAGLAQRALQGDETAQNTMKDIFQADLRGSFGPR